MKLAFSYRNTKEDPDTINSYGEVIEETISGFKPLNGKEDVKRVVIGRGPIKFPPELKAKKDVNRKVTVKSQKHHFVPKKELCNDVHDKGYFQSDYAGKNTSGLRVINKPNEQIKFNKGDKEIYRMLNQLVLKENAPQKHFLRKGKGHLVKPKSKLTILKEPQQEVLKPINTKYTVIEPKLKAVKHEEKEPKVKAVKHAKKRMYTPIISRALMINKELWKNIPFTQVFTTQMKCREIQRQVLLDLKCKEALEQMNKRLYRPSERLYDIMINLRKLKYTIQPSVDQIDTQLNAMGRIERIKGECKYMNTAYNVSVKSFFGYKDELTEMIVDDLIEDLAIDVNLVEEKQTRLFYIEEHQKLMLKILDQFVDNKDKEDSISKEEDDYIALFKDIKSEESKEVLKEEPKETCEEVKVESEESKMNVIKDLILAAPKINAMESIEHIENEKSNKEEELYEKDFEESLDNKDQVQDNSSQALNIIEEPLTNKVQHTSAEEIKIDTEEVKVINKEEILKLEHQESIKEYAKLFNEYTKNAYNIDNIWTKLNKVTEYLSIEILKEGIEDTTEILEEYFERIVVNTLPV